jgi:hypothetical protein
MEDPFHLLLAEGESRRKPHVLQGFKRFRRTQMIEEGSMAFAYHAYQVLHQPIRETSRFIEDSGRRAPVGDSRRS